jgi:hypothetical protein
LIVRRSIVSNVFDKSVPFEKVISELSRNGRFDPRVLRNKDWKSVLYDDVVFHVCSAVLSRVVELSWKEVCSESGVEAGLTTRSKFKSLDPVEVDWKRVKLRSKEILGVVVDDVMKEVLDKFVETGDVERKRVLR